MDRLRWIFELVDRMSGPAKSIAQAQAQVTRATQDVTRASSAATKAEGAQAAAQKSVASAAKALARVTQSGAASASAKTRAQMRLAQAHARARTAAMAQAAAISRLRAAQVSAAASASSLAAAQQRAADATRSLGSGIARIASAGALAGVAAIAAGIAGSMGLARGSIDAIVRRERELRTFGVLAGADQAGRLRARSMELSEFLGMSPQDVSTGLTRLMTQGFSEVDAVRIFQATADIQALDLTGDVDTGRIVTAISQIRSNGRLLGEELNQLAESGLPMQAILDGIGQAAGVASTEVRGMNGRIDAATAITGILNGVAATTGQSLGGLAREASLGLGGQLSRLGNLPDRFFAALADRASDTGSRLTGALASLNELLDPKSETATRAMDMIIGAIEWLTAAIPRAITKLEDLSAWWNDPLTQAQITLYRIEAERLFFGIATGIQTAIRWGRTMAPAFSTVASIIDGALRGIGATVDVMVVTPIRTIATAIEAAIGALESARQRMHGVGGDMMSGMTGGIIAGAGGPIGAVVSTAMGAISAAESALGIRSPSRVFHEIGAYTAEGFALGVDDGPKAAISAPSIDSMGMGAGGILGRGAGASITINVSVEGGGSDAREQGETIAEIIAAQLASAFDSLAIEGGAA